MGASRITLDGVPMEVNPTDVNWTFNIKMSDSKAVGGKVIQVIGVTWSDLTIRGRFAPNRAKGDTHVWQQQQRWREKVKAMAKAVEGAPGDRSKPLRFTYPDRKWDFKVFVRSLTPITYDVGTVAPEWEMVLFPLQDGTREIVKGVKDLYIARLMDGIGWKQTAYNGPSSVEVTEMLDGRSVKEYVRDEFNKGIETGPS